MHTQGFPDSSVGTESTYNDTGDRLQCKRPRFNPWVGKLPWIWKWQPTPVFLPGESHGQRSLTGYGPWGRRVKGDLVTKQQSYVCVCVCVCDGVVKLCSPLCDPMDCSLPGSMRFPLLEWVANSFSRIFLTQGLNPCLLHWQAGSLPLNH